MCGLVGVCSANNRPVDLSWISKGGASIAHRGPDASGEWRSEDGCVAMAHQRLSIVDLSSAGCQPMRNKERGLTIVFNGEIYNHHALRKELSILGYYFRSRSDTEVLLAAYSIWGKDCISKLNGMFVFVIYDERLKKLFVARDRAGEKPFFYHYSNGIFRFSSELKALFVDQNISRELNIDALNHYLAMGYTPSEHCMVKGFNKLLPAHALEFNLEANDLKIWRYWSPEQLELKSKITDYNEHDLLEQLEVLLNDSVSQQLEADVSTGVLLSGGLDSSLIVAMAAKNSIRPVETFTVGVPGDDVLDESKHALLIANYFNTNHHVLNANPEDAVDIMTILASQFDDPIADSSIIPTYMISKLVSSHCSVVLGGDGGDELFGGYSHYSHMLKMEKYFRHVPDFVTDFITFGSKIALPVGFKGRSFLQRINVNKRFSPYFDSKSRYQLLKNNKNYTPIVERYEGSDIGGLDLIYKASMADFENYLPNDILVKVDRSGMVNSLEVRAPFLDYRIIEFAFNKVPSFKKVFGNDKKILLKKLAIRMLPKEFDYNRKQGFSMPIKRWLEKGPFRELVWDVLTDDQCMFDRKMIDRLLANQDRGYSNSERLFALTMFELWRLNYRIDSF
jgi:asparagine synthase (glutamine-hydrolysing)